MSTLPIVASAIAAAGAVLIWPGVARRPAIGPRARASTREAAPAPGRVPVAVVIELVAAALGSGLPPGEAVAAVLRACGGSTARDLQPVVDALRLGAGAQASWRRAGPAYETLANTMLLADRTGAAAATALRRAAVDERAARRRRAQVAARRLGVHLVLPLGLATLPSFVLLGVAPVVLGLAAQFLSG